jgi:hypothetical protein
MQTVFDAHVDPTLVERSLAASAFGSMWLDIPRPEHDAVSGSVTTDLLVVGAGYTGLWTALHAAQRNPGQTVVLVDADRVGWAASGRNSGFVDASLTHGVANGKSRWPNEFQKLEALGQNNLDGMQADIEQLALAVDWERTGMLSVATEPHQVAWLREAADDGEGQFLGQGEVHDEVSSPTYLAACSAPAARPSSIPQNSRSNSPAPASRPVSASTSEPTSHRSRPRAPAYASSRMRER